MTEELLKFCNEKIEEMAKKADHNKRETLWSFKVIMISSLVIPLFIAFGPNEWISKVIPSVLSAVSAFVTAWIQLRKPNQLWTLYRTSQRELEQEVNLYKFESKKYKSSENKEQLLIEEFSEKYYKINEQWAKLVPKSEDAIIKKKE